MIYNTKLSSISPSILHQYWAIQMKYLQVSAKLYQSL